MDSTTKKCLADMWHHAPRDKRPWDVPTRAIHPALDAQMQWIAKHKRHNDYEILRILSQARPANDLTHLCSCLCMDGAAQGLSDKTCTLFAMRNQWDLDDLFFELLPHLVSNSGIQTFHDMCGRDNPNHSARKQCQSSFRSMDNEWERRAPKYGEEGTGKFFLRRSNTDALYVLIFHPELYKRLISDPARHRFYTAPYFDPYDSVWVQILSQDPDALDWLALERGYIPTPEVAW
jgi:hypothetical protein